MPQAYIQFGNRHQHKPASFADIQLHFPQPGKDLSALLKNDCISMYYQSAVAMPSLIQSFDADYLLVACWPELLSQKIIASVSIAALNLHPSLLPKFRGLDPIGAQLENGDLDFGISLHLLTERFDEGDIVLQQRLSVGANTSVSNVNKVAAIQGAKLFMQAVKSYRHPGWSLTSQRMP